MPISPSFSERLLPILEPLTAALPTPFFVYDQMGITSSHRETASAFGDWPYRQFFAVKALPNPAILSILAELGSGLDCSSPMELELARGCGTIGRDIVFTSNNTSAAELDAALAAGAQITFDDLRYFERLKQPPAVACFRLAPPADGRSSLMGNAEDSKFGMDPDQLLNAYRVALAAGVKRFGIYGMACANELSSDRALAAGHRLLEMARRVKIELGLAFEFVNFGGGIGIPYRPGEGPFDLQAYARGLIGMTQAAFNGRQVPILTEFGRSITGPHGVLVTRVVSRTFKRRELVGVDAGMSCLLRPALYGAYHHITPAFAVDAPTGVADVVGSMCENGDRLASQREMLLPQEGDLLLVHDVGAHAHAMGMTYNGRLRPAELLLEDKGTVRLIRRAETQADLLATCRNDPIDLHDAILRPPLEKIGA